MLFSRVKSFLAVVISDTFADAAEITFSTQATISKHIQSLEKELGFQLFDRSHRKATLTPAGKIFLRHAQQLMGVYNELTQELSSLEAEQRGVTTLASIPVMAHYGIISLIGEFRKAHPHIQLIVDERESCDILSSLEQAQYEMAFMRSEDISPSHFEWMEVFADRLVAVLPKGHPLASAKEISLNDLEKEDFLLLGPQSGLHAFVLRTCKTAGFAPKIAYTGTRMENIMEMVSQGMGISLLMATPSQFILRPDAVIVPLSQCYPSQIALVRHRKRSLSGAGKAFWAFIKQKKRDEFAGGKGLEGA